MFRHILVPLDGSMRAEQALPIAARLARASRGTITLFQAVTLAYEVSPYGIEAPYLAPHRIEETLAISRHYLEQQRTGGSFWSRSPPGAHLVGLTDR